MRASFEIACLVTPRSRAASLWEIHSEIFIEEGLILVDNVNLFYYHENYAPVCAIFVKRR